MAKPQVQVVQLEKLDQDRKNANKGTERGSKLLAKSVEKLGAGRSMVVDKNGRLVAGNKTHQALIEAGFKEAVVVETDGQTPVIVKRTDWDLEEKDGAARQYAYYDNRVSELDLSWDVDQIKEDLSDGMELSDLFTDKEMDRLAALDFLADADPEEEEPGSKKHDIDSEQVTLSFVVTAKQQSAIVAALNRAKEYCQGSQGDRLEYICQSFKE